MCVMARADDDEEAFVLICKDWIRSTPRLAEADKMTTEPSLHPHHTYRVSVGEKPGGATATMAVIAKRS